MTSSVHKVSEGGIHSAPVHSNLMDELYASILEAHRARVDARRLTEASLMLARE